MIGRCFRHVGGGRDLGPGDRFLFEMASNNASDGMYSGVVFQMYCIWLEYPR